MRVLITSPVFPPDLGGPAVYVPSVARFLMERGHEVRVVAFCSESAPQGHPFRITAIPRGPLPVRYLKAFWAVLREASWADVVYVNEHLALLHVLAAKLRGVPCTIRIMVDGSWEIAHRKGWCGQDDIVTFQTRDYGFKVRLTRFLQRRWWKWCRHIISCSDFLRDLLIEHHGVPPDKVQRIFNAYHGPRVEDVRETPEQARRALDLDVEPRYVLTICRLMGWKRVDGILRALAQLPADVHLLIAGDGDMEPEWRALAAELGLAERAHFLGNVAHERIPLYIRSADVFVLNSEYEGLSHTLLEVQSLGTPMIASDVCGNPEVVVDGQNGLLVSPDRPDELAAAITRILSDPELARRFVADGLERARAFTRVGTFGQVEQALARVAGKPLPVVAGAFRE
ncbi:MAG: glycosyltransferase involved in cell wall biosynthesis [Chlamydiales bacterium]|jgi:glycosyltransferase involved in cell wall biosynthesis